MNKVSFSQSEEFEVVDGVYVCVCVWGVLVGVCVFVCAWVVVWLGESVCLMDCRWVFGLVFVRLRLCVRMSRLLHVFHLLQPPQKSHVTIQEMFPLVDVISGMDIGALFVATRHFQLLVSELHFLA